MKKILVVFGTRPEAIKMAPLIKSLKLHPSKFDVKVCVTGQHREMLDQVLEIFGIQPDVDLNLMKSFQSLTQITSSILLSMSEVLRNHKTDIVLVHGDTSTTFATALAAFYSNIKIGHIEAGLRSGNILAPYPEEFNRITVSTIADLHFAPTESCEKNLLDEGINPNKIFVTGNTVVDALNIVLEALNDDHVLNSRITYGLDNLLQFDWQNEKYILITGHRRENFGDGIIEICKSIHALSQEHPDVHFIYPVHLNPNIKKVVYEMLEELPNVHLLAPLDYLSFTMLLKNCYLVLTDSGGLQEEAPTLGKPLLLMRDVTERPEGVETGNAKLVGTNQSMIVNEIEKLLTDQNHYRSMANAVNPYGDGNASNIIAQKLLNS